MCRKLCFSASIQIFVEATCTDWFSLFKDSNFNLRDKKRENQSRKVEEHQLQVLLDDNQSQKMFAKHSVLLNQPLPCAYMPWERFKGSKKGCHMNWRIGRWRDAKTHEERSRSCIGLWLAMQNFKNSESKKYCIDPGQPSTLTTRPNCFRRKTMCIWWISTVSYTMVKL